MRNIVRQLRRQQELSQEALARAVGASRRTIIDIEKGKTIPSGKLMLRIASYFGKEVGAIFFDDVVETSAHELQRRC